MKMTKVLSIAMATAMAAGAFTTVASAADTWMFGGIGPLTGPAADYGISAMNGAQIAADEINAAGGINGFEVSFRAEDDAHDADQSVSAYNTLKDWGMQALVGCVTTNPCIAVSDYAAEDQTFLLTPSASSEAVTLAGDNLFQMCFTDPAQGAASAQYIGTNMTDITKVGVIYNQDAYSTGVYATFRAEAENQPFEIVADASFTEEDKDFSVQIAAMQEAGAELVFLPIYYTPASLIFTQAAAADFAPMWFGVDGMDGILTAVEGFDTSLAEGVILLTPFAADAQDEKTQSFVKAYGEAFDGAVPSQFAADGYDCVYVLKQAIEEAGITPDASREEICAALTEAICNITFEGTTGTATWTEDGRVSKTPAAVVIKDGAYVAF